MSVHWICTCGFRTDDKTKVFTHRDGTDSHHLKPIISADEPQLIASRPDYRGLRLMEIDLAVMGEA